MTKTIAKELKEVQELIQENQRLQEKYPHNKKGLEIGLQSLMEIEKEMTQAVIIEKAKEIKTDNRFIYTTKKNGTLIIIDKQDNVIIRDMYKACEYLNELNNQTEQVKKIIRDDNDGVYKHSSEALADIIETLKER